MALAKIIGKTPRPQPKPFVGFVADDVSREIVQKAAERHGISQPDVNSGSISTAVQRLAGAPTPNRLLVDLSGCPDPMADLSALADVCDNGIRVLTIGDVNDVNLYRTLIAAGIDDYIVKPVTVEAILGALQQQDAPTVEAEVDDGLAHVVAITGTRGGVGATTIASNCAWIAANEYNIRTALVDLDLYFGTCGLALDLETGRGLREALENPERMDGLFVERAMVRDGDNLFMLGTEDDLDNSHEFDPIAMQRLIDQLRGEFKRIIIDLPRFAARTQLSLLTPPVSVVLVTEPSLSGMRDTKRLAKAVKNTAPGADLNIVLNRVGAMKGAELSQKDFEQGTELKVDFSVPFDAKAAALSAGSGKPFAKGSSRSKTVKQLQLVTEKVARIETGSAKGSSWRRMLRMSR
ncbi:MAG: hypothetical protein KIT00_10270 [Rhodospirillales bacterium]|nr:hypothetical protein [Rhodospirillales bacterium]